MTQVPRPSQRPVDAPVVPGDASTPDSPAAGQSAVSVTHPESSVRDRIARALREHGTPLPDDGYPADEYECCADHLLADTELLDALVAYRQRQTVEPIAPDEPDAAEKPRPYLPHFPEGRVLMQQACSALNRLRGVSFDDALALRCALTELERRMDEVRQRSGTTTDAPQDGLVGLEDRDYIRATLLAEGWRPPQAVETAAELGALPDRTIIRTCYGTAAQKSDETWEFPNEVGQWLGAAIDLPATVLWSPPAAQGDNDVD